MYVTLNCFIAFLTHSNGAVHSDFFFIGPNKATAYNYSIYSVSSFVAYVNVLI